MNNAKIAALEATANGTPQAEIARELGVDRMTVRKWLGKR
jgi:transposase-like protein